MHGTLGVLLDGGGARAAYQVGLLRFLAREAPQLRIPILTGVSAGAINAAALANRAGTFADAVSDLTRLWEQITVERVFRVDLAGLAKSVLGWSSRLLSGGAIRPVQTRALTDTRPLREFLSEALQVDGGGVLTGVRRNLEKGLIDSIGITTTDYSTGLSTTWTQGQVKSPWTRPHRRSVPCPLNLDHIMASAALPLLFPAIRIGDSWHGDGGIRMTAPLSPAVHLGADRILVVSTKASRKQAPVGPGRAPYPPPAQVAGVLLNTLFLDMIEYDCANMRRVNRLLDFVPESERGGLRRVEILTIRPTLDLGRLAGEYEAKLPRGLRFLLQGWASPEMRSHDFSSLLMFQRDFVLRLMEQGEADAAARRDEILSFVTAQRSS